MFRRSFFGAAFAFAALALPLCAKAPASYNIPLWPEGQVPLAKGNGPLDRPFLSVFPATPGKENGGSVVIAPGGSNIMLMYGGEGMEVAEQMNDWGYTAFILTYRLSPRYGEDARVLDGKQAMKIVKERAAAMKLDPNRIGFLGFSAGSALARSVAAASPPGDPAHPVWLGMVYSAGQPTPGESLKDFPPTFLLAAQFDKGASLGSANLFTELTRAGAIAEMHIYQQGRHGFGSGYGSTNFSDWMGRLKHFLTESRL